MELATFRLRVGQRLGVVPVSGTLSAEDGDLVTSAYELLVAELMTHGLAFWGTEDAVPDDYADILIGMTAAMLVDDFTIAEPRRTQIIGQYAFGLPQPSVNERRLRRLMAVGMGEEATEAEYF